MPSRPYINWSAADLEKVFLEHPKNSDVLQILLVELNHRRTRLAKKLKEQVIERLSSLGAAPPTSSPTRDGQADGHYSAFLSYARADAGMADQVRKIIDQSNLPTWIDTAGISPGQQWEATIRRALVQSDCLILIVTANVKGSFVEKEIELALDMRKPIIPVIFDDFWGEKDDLAQRIRKHQAIDFRDSKKAAQAKTSLVNAVKSLHLAPVLAVYSPKGGVGKTTLSAHLSSYFFKRTDKDTLLIDLDPQANLSTLLVRPRPENQGLTRGRMQLVDVLSKLRDLNNSAYGLLNACAEADAFKEGMANGGRYIHNLDAQSGRKWDIVAGDKRITQWAIGDRDVEAWQRVRRGFGRFVERCRALYDCIIIDMNPSVTDLTMLALGVASDIVSPVKPDIYSLQGLDLLEEISMEQVDEANGLGRVIIINEPKRDKEQLVRRQIGASAFADRLVKNDFADSSEFYASPSTNLATDLSWLPAYGNWGPSPSPARRALQSVGTEVAHKTGIRMQ